VAASTGTAVAGDAGGSVAEAAGADVAASTGTAVAGGAGGSVTTGTAVAAAVAATAVGDGSAAGRCSGGAVVVGTAGDESPGWRSTGGTARGAVVATAPSGPTAICSESEPAQALRTSSDTARHAVRARNLRPFFPRSSALMPGTVVARRRTAFATVAA